MTDIRIFDQAVILTGPTASGKSAIALEWAQLHNAEIVSMDSMAVYRGMDIGTAKPSNKARERVRHHLIDCLYPWEKASVAWWLSEAHRATSEILERKKHVLIVGGTPLYLKALVHGLFQGPEADPKLRAELEQIPADQLHQRLHSVDPDAAGRIHPHDQKRLVRALEVFQLTGKPMTDWQLQFRQTPATRLLPILCLDIPRHELYQRIERRVDVMMHEGWLEEVKTLQQLPLPLSKEAGQAAGYRELTQHLAGECSLEEAVAATKTRCRQLAKRQLTWFRNFPGLVYVSPQDAQKLLAAISPP